MKTYHTDRQPAGIPSRSIKVAKVTEQEVTEGEGDAAVKKKIKVTEYLQAYACKTNARIRRGLKKAGARVVVPGLNPHEASLA